MAVEEFRARGTLDERLIDVELGGFQEKERWNKWTFMIARSGETLEFVVENTGTNFKAKEEYTEEEAKNLQRALGKYQTILEELRSTGEVRGWL